MPLYSSISPLWFDLLYQNKLSVSVYMHINASLKCLCSFVHIKIVHYDRNMLQSDWETFNAKLVCSAFMDGTRKQSEQPFLAVFVAFCLFYIYKADINAHKYNYMYTLRARRFLCVEESGLSVHVNTLNKTSTLEQMHRSQRVRSCADFNQISSDPRK